MFQQKSTCHDHRAVNNVNKHGGHLDSTGIGATACIHGTFVPDSVVDFQKGEAYVLTSISIPGETNGAKARKTWIIQYAKPLTLIWTA